jgi:hypothetical protein
MGRLNSYKRGEDEVNKQDSNGRADGSKSRSGINRPSPSDQKAFIAHCNYGELARYYAENPVVLYVGAGISWAKDVKFGLRGWDDLIRRVLVENKGAKSKKVAEFDMRVQHEWGDEPWKMADWVSETVGLKALERHVVKIVQRGENFSIVWKQLSGRYLRKAPTLNAVAAFCGRLTGFVEGTIEKTYRVAPNSRVAAVVSTNYDPYLEAAASTMFGGENPLKPVGALGSSAGSLKKIPVFHIHGYVRFPESEKSRKKRTAAPRKAMVDPVLTTQDYKCAWRRNNVFGFTMGPQIHYLRHYTALFIGFSFRDRWVRRLLINLNRERQSRPDDRLYHYALLSGSNVEAKGEYLEKKLGVKAIPLEEDFSDLSKCLGDLYQHGLKHDASEKRVKIPIVARQRAAASKERESLKRGQQKVDAALGRRRTRGVARISFSDYWQALFDCRT